VRSRNFEGARRGDGAPPRVMTLGPMADCQATQGWTGCRSADPEVFRHVGWPNPDLLTPVPPFGFAVMSKMMLSGRAGSAETPPNSGQRVGGGQVIETEEIPHSPGDIVIRAGGVAAQAHSADELMACA